MYCVQERICCGVFNKAVLPDNYPSYLKSQCHVTNVLRNQCTESIITKTHHEKR